MGVSKEETRAAANQSEYDDSEDDFAQDMDKKKIEIIEDPTADDDLKEEEMKQEVLDQFDVLYNKDPELREALSKSKVSDLDVEQKYEII